MAPSDPPNLMKAQAQAVLAAIVESSDDAIVSKTLQGIVSTWNKGAERIFGYAAAEMIGRPITAIIPPDRQDEEPHILSRIAAGQRVDHFETVRMRKDGRLIDVSVTISPVRDASGTIVGASKVARDITAQKQIERELRLAKESAEAANSAKDRFLSVLSHELRTPLTPVLGAISLIESNPTLSGPELREQVGMIRRNIETEARLVDDLLDLTRISRGKVRLHFEAVDANAVLRAVVTMLQPEADAKGLAVTVALRAKEALVWADAGRLQQVFLNLLSNAVKFTPEGGSVTVRSSNHDGQLVVEIVDTGIGIEPDVLPRLFRPFEQGEQTVTREFAGLGLGLSIVRSLLDMHGGSVSVASGGKDQGATFIVELATMSSTDEPRPDNVSNVARIINGSGPRPIRVLLVEDHADTRAVLARLLKSFGCDVTAVGTVKHAVELSDREPFDLLVSDIGLPDGSGTQVMSHMRARHQVKGIAISGFGQEEDLRRSAEAGFDLHLTKPVNFQTLKDVILKVAS
jgi:PAS domain S-box-containing protein